ncbi:AraC family transcriptional regulator [uncultured Arcticibacterium sp.]|uniref:AraC family transcriptional regulator n=1 Tax=uncultured Arcticibacterium sp. TaxID=2173042 RepID=UPI0030F60B51
MKAVLEHISPNNNHSVVYRELELPNFDSPFHYHPECELTLIVKGKGTRHVGIKMEEFQEGELVFLGPNLPHCWLDIPKSDGEFVKSYVIQFKQSIFENTFFQLPEFKEVKKLFSLSKAGIRFEGNHREAIEGIFQAENNQRILGLMTLFLELASQPSKTILDIVPSQGTSPDRFHSVFSYIIEHFREDISLNEVAEKAGLTPTSFCRYFKKTTGKTLFEVILDYRLEAAAQLLASSSMRINEVAFESGFDDIPYFNRAFKKWKGVSPKVFRKG